MNYRITLKKLISFLLIFIPVILLINQQITGFWALRENTPDPIIFSTLLILAMCIGYSLQGSNVVGGAKNFVISALLLYGIPVLFGFVFAIGNLFIYHSAEIETFGMFYVFYVMGIQSGVSTDIVYQICVVLVPITVLFIAFLKIILDTQTGAKRNLFERGLVEAILIMLIIIFSVLGGWLGLQTLIDLY